MTTSTLPQQLRRWAAGSYPVEAATELLLRARDGRFAQAENPWIHTDDRGYAWINFADINPETTGVYSGGERRVLAIAAALGSRTPLDLAENITGLDRTHAQLVLAALAHAMGTHHHNEIRRHPTTGAIDLIELDSLHSWPPEQAFSSAQPEAIASTKSAGRNHSHHRTR